MDSCRLVCRAGGVTRRGVPAAVLLAGLTLLFPSEVCAYIDPGTGSLLYQTTLALVLGAGIVFRRAFGRIAGFVMGLLRRHKGAPTPRNRE